ncbi:PREDICTED: AT-rich interactive domain-containing protein 4B-like [Polistes dominula]|uniref:AT-rich interactive domain-containing protein 4B-like n=1 Tax=Polistes dominula TaxID=743375 RepID=A0ABM1I5V1_POLDO|nr:PREDICTED: AT-rich interactive domain-containing protein 4B-like [Polistes dominula]
MSNFLYLEIESKTTRKEEDEETDQDDLDDDEERSKIEHDDQDDEDDDEDEEEEECEECKEVEDDTPLKKLHYKCKYPVENSSRFSLRVMEAMRSLQKHENVLPISSRKEIVDYIEKNYNNDGDLNAQVRTSLKQLCTQGFVAEVLNDEYQLIGPFSFTRILEDCECFANVAKKRMNTPKFTRRNNNSRKYPVNEETKKHNNRKRLISNEDQQTVDDIQEDNDDHRTFFHKRTPKRVRKTNDNIPATSGSVEKNQETIIASNNQVNNNSQDDLFQEIENSISEKSKSREKELKKWIQRCRRECEKQKKK